MASQVQSTNNLAFNISLVAYDFNIPGRKPNQVLAVRKVTKMKSIRVLLVSSDPQNVPPIGPSEAELLIKDDSITGLWVGMRPSDAMQYRGQISKDQTKKDAETGGSTSQKPPGRGGAKAGTTSSQIAKRGSSVSKNQGYTKIAFDTAALRVIAPIGKDNANYYSLVNEENGLCIGHHTSIEEVFFFPEFRDDNATSVQQRRATWGKIIREACGIQTKGTWSRDYDKTKFVIDAKRNLGNELSTLVSAYRMGGDKTLLKTAMDLIDIAENDKSFESIQDNGMLFKMVNTKEVLDMEDCRSTLTQLRELAPELESLKIQPEEIQQISDALVNSKIVLEYRLLRAFIVDFIREIRKAPGSDLMILATTTRDHVLLQLGQVLLPSANRPDGFSQFLAAETDKIQEIANFARLTIEALKDSQGSVVAVAPSLPQIWSKYGNSPDVDSAKFFAAHLHRFNVQGVAIATEPVVEALDTHVKRLKMLGKTLAEDESSPLEDSEVEESDEESGA